MPTTSTGRVTPFSMKLFHNKILSIFCLFLLGLPYSAAADFVEDELSSEERVWLQGHPHIRVAIDTQWAPIEFVNEERVFQGISADYLRLLAPLLGVHFEVEKTLSWQETIKSFKRGELDIFTSVRPTSERKEFMLFSTIYTSFSVAIFTGPDILYIGKMAELEGRRVAVVDGYAVQELLAANHPGVTLVPVLDVEHGLHMLNRGKVDAYVDNILVASYYLEKLGYPDIRVAGETPYSNDQTMGVRKDWPMLVSILNKALRAIPLPEHNRIYSRWISINYPKGFDYTLLWQVVLAAVAIIAVVIYWNRRLAAEISKKRHAQIALQAERDMSRNYLATVEVMLIVLDLQGNIVLLNRKGCEMLGYAEKELLGRNWFTTCLPQSAEKETVLPVFKQILTEDQANVTYFENDILTKSGEQRLFAWHTTMLRNLSGEISGTISSGEDITESRLAEIKLCKAKEAADAANRVQKRFIANMNHELRTPLHLIIGFSSQLSAARNTPESSQEPLTNIYNSGNRLLAIVNEVIEQSKSIEGYTELQNTDIDLRSMINDLSEKIHELAENKGLQFIIDCSEHLPDFIRTDPVKLHDILYNLLVNGIKFTEKGQVILRLDISEAEDRNESVILLSIQVEDSGIGIALADQERIFEPFVQLGPDSLNMGTGLGLSLIMSYLQLMDGKISVQSKVGKGSTFRVILPVQKAEKTNTTTRFSPHFSSSYIGREESENATENRTPDNEDTIDMLASLPDDLFTELHEAALALDIELALTVIERIKVLDEPLAAALQHMVESIEFNTIQELLRQTKKQTG